MIPTSQRLVTFRLISRPEPLRHIERVNVERNPFGAADCGTDRHFGVAFLPGAVGIHQNRSGKAWLFIPSRSRVMVSSVVLPFSHHQ